MSFFFLYHYFRNYQMLLVFDNFIHLYIIVLLINKMFFKNLSGIKIIVGVNILKKC